MTPNPKFSFVFVLGMGHSGTTLIGRMLGTHPNAICVGEILRLEQALAEPGEKCSCGVLLSECSFWQQLLPHLPDGVKRDYENWSAESFEQIKTRTGRDLIIDTSKSRAFRLRSRWEHHHPGFILVIRDPRGVMRSSLRSGGELNDLLKIHLKWIKRYLNFVRDEPHQCTAVFYEDLIAAPERELRRVCEFIGLSFQPEMLTPDTQTQHLVRASSSRYLKGSNRLEQDERWRNELSPAQISEICRTLRKVPIYRERYRLT